MEKRFNAWGRVACSLSGTQKEFKEVYENGNADGMSVSIMLDDDCYIPDGQMPFSEYHGNDCEFTMNKIPEEITINGQTYIKAEVEYRINIYHKEEVEEVEVQSFNEMLDVINDLPEDSYTIKKRVNGDIWKIISK